jgi:uncharacterized protein YyaL (SSP411 family)
MGGFFRYSTTADWQIPHFEKMLYDNGPLLALYSQAWAATNDRLFARVAEETADWVLTEMQAPEGGYYSTLDADSEGEEGRFYVWDRDEARELVGEDAWPVFAALYGLDRDPNFEGRWHLHRVTDLSHAAAAAGIDEEQAAARVDEARARLFERRATRVRPGRDEKILTAWNGLMIQGMAVAARHLGRAELADSATRAVDFLRGNVWRDGRLRVGCKDGRAGVEGFLDDYAFLLAGLLELLQVRWRGEFLAFCVELAEVLLGRFQDPAAGGFYFTADDQETLIHRPRPLADEATPSGNGVAARALNRLGLLIGEPRYVEAAEQTLRMAWPQIREHPQAHCSLLDALEEQLEPVETVILRGAPGALAPWHQTALLAYAPRRQVFAIPNDAPDLPPGLAAKAPADGPVGYRCVGPVCGPPLRSLSELARALRETPETAPG